MVTMQTSYCFTSSPRKKVSLVLSPICALVTIAVAWIFYRPVLGVILLVAAGFFAWKLIMRRNAKKAKAAQAA